MSSRPRAIVARLALLAVWAVIWASPAFAVGDGWQPFESTDGRFAVLFPRMPQVKQSAPQLRPATACICEMPGNRVFLITFEDPPGFAEQLAKASPAARTQMIENGLDSGLDGTLKAARQVLGRRKITLRQYSGREFEAELPDGTFLRQRVYSVEGRIYTVGVGGPKAIFDSPDAEKFFTSFKLLELEKLGSPLGPQPTYSDPTMHFSFAVPSGWQRMTKEELDQLFTDPTLLNPSPRQSANPSPPDARFYLAGRPSNSAPYIAVSHQAARQPTLTEMQDGISKMLQRLQEANPAWKFEGPTIDEARHMVSCWWELQDSKTGKSYRTESATFSGRPGGIALVFVCPTSELAAFAPVWQRVLDSFKFDEGFAYSEPTLTQKATDHSLLILAGAGVVLAVYIFRRSRLRRTETTK